MRQFLLAAALLAAAAAAAPAQPAQLTGFDQLAAALRAGQPVRAVVHYGKCLLVSEQDTLATPDAIGGMELATWEYFAANAAHNPLPFISASQTVLIGGKKGHLYDYVRLKFLADGRVEIVARYLEPPKLKVKMDETFFTTINTGADSGAVYLYLAK